MKASYIPAPEVAKLVRAVLKTTFPSTKFSVRSHTYPGGASLDVAWTDGPSVEAVEAIAGQFAGARLDGVIEVKVRVLHWLLPDGTTTIASNEGTRTSLGVLPPERGWMPHPEARLVHFGPDFIFCNRHRAADPVERVLERT